MTLRILVAPDKFKGTLTAAAAAEAIARGWRQARPGDQLDLLPISDGGDGFGEVLRCLLDARPQVLETQDAAHRPLRAQWWWSASRTAIIESAGIIGLALLPQGRFHPFELDTFGLGAALVAAARKKPERCLVGVGGSATNDGGFGMARALGWQFLSRKEERPMERWTELWALEQFFGPKDPLQVGELSVAVDVQNPLLGPVGATRVYGPQKGLGRADLPLAERCLTRLAQVAKAEFKQDHAGAAGAGAAGGLGFAFRAFLGARLLPGFQLFADHAGLAERLGCVDLVVTGEGSIDGSTFMGKGVGELARLCRDRNLPCIALGGRIGGPASVKSHFFQAHAVCPDLAPADRAQAEAARYLELLAKRVAGTGLNENRLSGFNVLD